MGLFSRIAKAFRSPEPEKKPVNPDDYLPKPFDPVAYEAVSGDYDPSSYDDAIKEHFSEFGPESPVVIGDSELVKQDEEWFWKNTPEQCYSTFSPGDSKQKMFDHHDGTGMLATAERTTFDVVEPCGFDFSDAVVRRNNTVDFETGEVVEFHPFIIPSSANFDKMIADWKTLTPLLVEAEQVAPSFPAAEILCYIENLHQLPSGGRNAPSDNVFLDWDYKATISVEPPTKTGKVKRYPIKTGIDMSWYEPFNEWHEKKPESDKKTLYLDGYYMKDGVIGKGKITFWKNRTPYVLEFARDTKTGERFIKKIRTSAGLRLGEWKILYPFGQD